MTQDLLDYRCDDVHDDDDVQFQSFIIISFLIFFIKHPVNLFYLSFYQQLLSFWLKFIQESI
jgi:hypothetical protein